MNKMAKSDASMPRRCRAVRWLSTLVLALATLQTVAGDKEAIREEQELLQNRILGLGLVEGAAQRIEDHDRGVQRAAKEEAVELVKEIRFGRIKNYRRH